MIVLKNADEIKRMRAAGRVVAEALELAGRMVAEAVTTGDIDAAVAELIAARNGKASFLGYPKGLLRYPASTCISVNEEVVHGIPGKRRLRAGDLVSIDVGVMLDGFHADAARTFVVGKPRGRDAARLVATAREALAKAIAAARAGGKLSDVSLAIQAHAEGAGFSVVRQYVGHGVGRKMHEEPQIPNFVDRSVLRRDVVLKAGMTLALEPMINAGGSGVKTLANGWTVVTSDGSLSAHFEDTVAVTEDGAAVLTAP